MVAQLIIFGALVLCVVLLYDEQFTKDEEDGEKRLECRHVAGHGDYYSRPRCIYCREIV